MTDLQVRPEVQTSASTGPAISTPTPRRAGSSRVSRSLQVGLPPFLVFVGFIGVWYAYSRLRFGDNDVTRNNALPYPHDVVNKGFLPLWDDKNGFRPILDYLFVTIRVTMIGLAISLVLGIAIAVLMNLSKHLERAIFPYAVVLQTIPILAITPLLTQLFGDELGVRLVVVVLIAIFPVITNTLFGLQSTDRLHHDLFTLNRANRMTRLFKLELPTALPAIMTGIRIASGPSSPTSSSSRARRASATTSATSSSGRRSVPKCSPAQSPRRCSA
jgi:NitT/TauT family transport system permease protein